jgi:hypothetical protein
VCIVALSLRSGTLENARALADDDIRFVCIRQERPFRVDWLCGIGGGEDYWALAETFIAARRTGKVDREHLFSFLIVVYN